MITEKVKKKKITVKIKLQKKPITQKSENQKDYEEHLDKAIL